MNVSRIIGLGRFGFVLAGCGGAQRPGESFDAGAIFASRVPLIEHEFRVTNTTGRAIEIFGESHSCTCTEVKVKTGKLEAGETTTLHLKVRPYLNRADGSISCTLKTDHPEWKEWTYALRDQNRLGVHHDVPHRDFRAGRNPKSAASDLA